MDRLISRDDTPFFARSRANLAGNSSSYINITTLCNILSHRTRKTVRIIPTILLHRRNDGDIILQSVGNNLTTNAAATLGNHKRVIVMPTEAEMRLHRCCFTGHRPEKLNRSEKEIKSALRKEINQAIQDGLTVFITGMARGVDLWAAEIILEVRKQNKAIKLICAIPHEGFESRWSAGWKQLYRYVQEEADLVRIICKGYHTGVYQIRNEWMVNHSSRVIAVFNGQASGTKNTIDYAHRQGVPVVQIEG